ncbi:probable peroxidase 26 [Momordica charantia]|uniref:Peroxidase n=1 Tax=Momordica charantia TaxID=3673 RepID=A0A6J1CVX8_MOMCH|nr:probable peroxidase 26 [Momordica charantia]
MRRERRHGFVFVSILGIALVSLFMVKAENTLPSPLKLSWHYYKLNTTCPDAEAYIKHQVQLFWQKDKSITAKFLRLLSADCLSKNGCDGSILLDGPNSEKNAPQNQGLGGFEVIDKIKIVLEDRCPGVVSCADILNLATRDAAHLAGAPSYPVFTGRRDCLTTSVDAVDFPSPSISWQQGLAYFQSKGLDVLDMATLLGAHSMGKTHCHYIMDRLYNFNGTGKPDPSMNKSFLKELQKKCPKKSKQDPTVNLTPKSGNDYQFTGLYYSRILSKKAVLGIDQQLLFGDDTKEIVEEFAPSSGFEDFRKSFALSMSRMGSFKVLTGKDGEIRRDCRRRN